jgi:hypothetical protein
MQNSASGRGISSTSLDQGLSFSSDFGSADLTAREGFTRDATRRYATASASAAPPLPTTKQRNGHLDGRRDGHPGSDRARQVPTDRAGARRHVSSTSAPLPPLPRRLRCHRPVAAALPSAPPPRCRRRSAPPRCVQAMVRLALTLLLSRGREELEVIIATGTLPGPKLLLTGNIHGNEINPCIICHRVIEWLETAVTDGSLKGTVVLMPSLNPTGHRAGTRSPSFESVDPNRFWPDGFATEKTLSEELAKDKYADIYG